MGLTPEQREIINLVNQLPDDVKKDTLEIFSQMNVSTDTTKKDLKNVMMSSEMTQEEKEMLEKYKATQKIINEFHQFCLKLSEKEIPDYWDRAALSLESISQLALPLLQVWGKEVWFADKVDKITDRMKFNFIQLFTTSHFLDHATKNKTLEDFKNDLNKEIPKELEKLEKYSELMKNMGFDTNLNNCFADLLEKINKFDSTQEFTDKMWDNFVKDFLQKAPNIKTDEDKAWFFEQLFNITYHAADYIDHIKNNKNIMYCYNYQLLHNNFDLSKSDHYDFQVNHIEKSTRYSNLVYKWANELGIKQLKVLIEKYLIKP